MKHLFGCLALLLLLGPSAQGQDKPIVYQEIAIAADHPLASEAGLEVHRAGGNTVDVAAAVGVALAVVRPASSGLGGGGFMVIWDAEEQRSMAIYYRERAPAAAHASMYYDASGEAIPELSRTGHLAVAVPHHVAGLSHAVKRYGRLSLKEVLAPAIRLAREGFPLDEHAVSVRKNTLRRFERDPQFAERFSPFVEQYLNGGKVPEVGDRFVSPLAGLLEDLVERGPSAFHEGPAAEAFVREMERGGGIITLDDLKSVAPREREALSAEWDGATIVSMPPPSSGGVALIEILNILSAVEDRHPDVALALHDRNSPIFRHVLAESMKHAFADRATYLGDPDFAEIPTKRLISKNYAEELAERIDLGKTHPPVAYGRAQPVEDAGTTHFSVIDAAGNAVACTETINLTFGSFVVVPETGVILNNEMDDFAAKPGTPNAFGLVQSEASAVGPGRRPLSSMTPTIVVRDGKAVLAVGASGGPRIITATLQVLLNVTRFQMSPTDAVGAARQHHQWLPDVLLLEPSLVDSVGGQLEAFGHETEREGGIGACQIVMRTEKGLHAASDPRKGGIPAGQ